MFGDSLLVANVVEKGAKTRKVYLPEGEIFYDSITEPISGRTDSRTSGRTGSIPLFIRSGAIIPMAAHQLNNLMQQKVTAIRMICEAGRDGAFTLYEDDGATMEYTKGA